MVVPAGIPSEQAVCSYLATLGLHALRRIGFQPGENVVVMGLGVVGMAAALVASACGARVIAVDPDPSRRERAREAGRLMAAKKSDGLPEGVRTDVQAAVRRRDDQGTVELGVMVDGAFVAFSCAKSLDPTFAGNRTEMSVLRNPASFSESTARSTAA